MVKGAAARTCAWTLGSSGSVGPRRFAVDPLRVVLAPQERQARELGANRRRLRDRFSPFFKREDGCRGEAPAKRFRSLPKKHTRVGDVVFEPFSGSGSQLIDGAAAIPEPRDGIAWRITVSGKDPIAVRRRCRQRVTMKRADAVPSSGVSLAAIAELRVGRISRLFDPALRPACTLRP